MQTKEYECSTQKKNRKREEKRNGETRPAERLQCRNNENRTQVMRGERNVCRRENKRDL